MANPATKPVNANFISSYCNGEPVFTEVRVASDEEAVKIWQRIRAKDAAVAATCTVASELGRQGAGGTLAEADSPAPIPTRASAGLT